MRKVLITILIILLNVNLLQGAIDVGAPCINRADSFSTNYTWVEKTNACNATGTIDHIDIWMAALGGVTDFASFYIESGNNLSTRAVAEGLTTSVGDNNFNAPGDFTAFNINEGDYIGGSRRDVERDTGSYTGLWYVSGDKIPCTNQAFTFTTSWIISLYATGTESGGPPAPKIQSQILILE